MGRYVLDFELGVEAVSLRKANEKRTELENFIRSQFAEGELLYIDSDVEEEEEEEQDEEEEEEDTK
jgi:divalent metal cation (Fe/Co/Zn/Cd) transporter